MPKDDIFRFLIVVYAIGAVGMLVGSCLDSPTTLYCCEVDGRMACLPECRP